MYLVLIDVKGISLKVKLFARNGKAELVYPVFRPAALMKDYKNRANAVASLCLWCLVTLKTDR